MYIWKEISTYNMIIKKKNNKKNLKKTTLERNL